MSRKLTTAEFISKSKMIHGDKYDYSHVEYTKGKDEVRIICPIHGEFRQMAGRHLSGQGCPKCKGRAISEKLKMSTEDFVNKAISIHGNKYDYSLVEYRLSRIKVCIVCPEHGAFWQTPNNHLRGEGCPQCGNERVGDKCRYTTQQFVESAKLTHGDKYDYSITEYKSSHEKIKIICPKHGVFKQTPGSHLAGCGCKKCRDEKLSADKIATKQDFVTKARMVHGSKYDYSKVEYKGSYEPIDIICPIHGVFSQKPVSHLSGHGCALCGKAAASQIHRSSISEFIENARRIHGDKYSYELIKEYTNCDTKVPIICPKHGVFYQTPYAHTHGYGCKLCNESQGERAIALWLEDNGIPYKREYRIYPQRTLFGRNRFMVDFYLPNNNAIIEYHGIQHFELHNFFHRAEQDFILQQDRDIRLREYCKQRHIKLIEIPYTKEHNISAILKRRLK